MVCYQCSNRDDDPVLQPIVIACSLVVLSFTVSINPFKWLDYLYTAEMVDEFKVTSPGELVRPHVFAIANAAVVGMRDELEDQSIVISGKFYFVWK